MVKKCIVCEADASYKIKDTSEFYCDECAEEHFADVKNTLLKLEEEVQQLNAELNQRLEPREVRTPRFAGERPEGENHVSDD